MTGTTHPQAAAYDTWAEVVVLLDEAANRGYRDSATDPALHSTALAAHALAAAALELHPVEDLPLGASEIIVAICDLIGELGA